MKKTITLLGLGTLVLFCTLFVVCSVSAAITNYDTGKGHNIRLRGVDYVVDPSNDIYLADVAGGWGLVNTLFNTPYSFFNSVLVCGQSGTGTHYQVNLTVENKQWYFQPYVNPDIEVGNDTTLVNIIQMVRNNSILILNNMSIYVNDSCNENYGSPYSAFISSQSDIRINSSLLKTLNGELLASTANDKDFYINDSVLDSVPLSGGHLYLKNVVLQHCTNFAVQSGIYSAQNLIVKNNYYGVWLNIFQYNAKGITFDSNTYDFRLFLYTAKNNFTDCTFKNNTPKIYGTPDTGIFNLSYSHSYLLKNSSGIISNGNIRIWNRTGGIILNGTSDIYGYCNATLNSLICTHSGFDWQTNFTINISNGDEFENYSFNNSMQKVNEIVYLCPSSNSIIINNYYGNALFELKNPNPANNSMMINGSLVNNNIDPNNRGLNTSVDIRYNNFTNNTYYGKIFEYWMDYVDGTPIIDYASPLAETFQIGYHGENVFWLLNKVSVRLTGSHNVFFDGVIVPMVLKILDTTGGIPDSSKVLSETVFNVSDIDMLNAPPGIIYTIYLPNFVQMFPGHIYAIYLSPISETAVHHYYIRWITENPAWHDNELLYYFDDIDSAWYPSDTPNQVGGYSTFGYYGTLNNVVNLSSFWSTDGINFLQDGFQQIVSNGTYSIHNPNMTSANTQYWYRKVAESNGTIFGNETYNFNTGSSGSNNIELFGNKIVQQGIIGGSLFSIIAGLIVFVLVKKKKKEIVKEDDGRADVVFDP